MPRPPTRTSPHRSPGILLAAFAVFWFSETIADPDLWGHVRFGQDLLRSGRLAATDVYSYRSAGARWINHEWLSELAFAAVFDRIGPTGLVPFKLAIALGVVGLCWISLRRDGVSPAASAALLVVASIPFHLGMGTVRPQLFTYLAFAILLCTLERTGVGRERRLAWLPLLFAVWINLHGGVLAGVGVLGIWLGVRILGRLGERDLARTRRMKDVALLALPGLACLLALVANPYGVDLPLFLIRTATVPRPEITEWRPLNPSTMPGLLVLSLMGLAAVGLLVSRRPRRAGTVILTVVTAILTLVSARHYPLFVLAWLITGGEHIADACGRGVPPSLRRASRSPAVAIASVAIALVLVAASTARWRCIRIDAAHFAYPARAVALLKASGLRGNLALPFDWGEYALWHLYPGVKVSVDGRRETVYSDEAYRLAMDFEQGRAGWERFLETSRTDLVLLRNPSVVAARLANDPTWIPLYQDTFCVLFARAGLPDLSRIVRTPVPALPDDGDRLCFP